MFPKFVVLNLDFLKNHNITVAYETTSKGKVPKCGLYKNRNRERKHRKKQRYLPIKGTNKHSEA